MPYSQATADRLYEEHRYREALPQYEELARGGSSKNLLRLGYCRYWMVDFRGAIDAFEKAAAKGNYRAMSNCGILMMAIARNKYEEIYKKGDLYLYKASRNDPYALYNWAMMAKGNGTVAEVRAMEGIIDEVISKLRPSSSYDAEAQYFMGLCYFEIPAEIDQCYSYLEKSARKGHLGAMYLLSRLYAFGYAARYGDDEGLLEKAARGGYKRAQYDLATKCLLQKKNFQKAIYWFNELAKQCIQKIYPCRDTYYGQSMEESKADDLYHQLKPIMDLWNVNPYIVLP